jgi:hypothetical protein
MENITLLALANVLGNLLVEEKKIGEERGLENGQGNEDVSGNSDPGRAGESVVLLQGESGRFR